MELVEVLVQLLSVDGFLMVEGEAQLLYYALGLGVCGEVVAGY